jgi:hypothetical protein
MSSSAQRRAARRPAITIEIIEKFERDGVSIKD